MLRSHFRIPRDPFDPKGISLLPHQREILDILLVHAQQGGLCLLLGEPGAGKSVLKHALLAHDPMRLVTPIVNRTLHTYHNTLRIHCQAFRLEFEGRDHHCERLLVAEAFRLHQAGKMLVPIIDDEVSNFAYIDRNYAELAEPFLSDLQTLGCRNPLTRPLPSYVTNDVVSCTWGPRHQAILNTFAFS